MATLEDLQQQLQLLKAQIDALTTPPNEYYTLLYSGEEVDERLGREGGGTVKTVAGVGPDDDGNVPLTASSVKAAPGGYGLGGMSTLLTSADDLNNLYQCGWYKYTSENMPQNAVAASNINLLCVYSASNLAFVQTVYGITDGASYDLAPIARRFIYGSVSLPWEYFNPALVLGVEYRTIERYGGNPVYAQLVNFGTLPAASAKNVSVLPSGCNIFEVKGMCSNGVTLPGMITGTGQQPIFMYGYQNGIVVSTSADYGSVTATAVVKYTKTSD